MVLNFNWMALALIATSCWGMVNVIDKTILANRKVTIVTRQFIDSWVGLLIAFFLLRELSTPSFLLISLGALSGIIVFAFNSLYYNALRQADVSAVSVYLQLIPIFSAIIGFFFFKERFYINIYLGALFIIVGAIFVAIERTPTGNFTILLGKSMPILLKYLLPASLIMSINYGLIKYLLVQYSFWDVFFWGRIGSAFIGIFLFALTQGFKLEFNTNIKRMGFKTFYGIALVEFLNFFGMFILITAYSIGTITLVSTVTAIQPLIVIIMLVSIAIFRDKEPLKDFSYSERVLFIRIVAVCLQVIGMFLLYQSQI